MEEVQAALLEQKEENKLVDLDQDVNDIQENMENVSVPVEIEWRTYKIPVKKLKEIQWLN